MNGGHSMDVETALRLVDMTDGATNGSHAVANEAARVLAGRLREVDPPAGLSPVLASVDDVARMCEVAGLSEDEHEAADRRERSWNDGTVRASDRGGTLWVRVRGPGTSWISTTWYRQPSAPTWHAIQAARSAAHPDGGEQQ